MDIAAIAPEGDAASILLQAPAVTLSPASMAFGSEMVGMSSAPQTATVTNVGYAAVNISEISILGADPQDFTRPATAPPAWAWEKAARSWSHSPPLREAAGVPTLFVSDDGGNNPGSIALSGTGLAIVLSPGSLDFGSVMVGQTSQPMSSTVTNIGSTVVRVSTIIIKEWIRRILRRRIPAPRTSPPEPPARLQSPSRPR